jgi:DNA-binding MarR family transcriptional regulator
MNSTRDALALHEAVCRLRTGRRLPTLQARLLVALLCVLDGAPSADAPNQAQLARQLGIARATLQGALRALARKGWLVETVEILAVERIELRPVRRITLTLPAGLVELAAPANPERRRAG